jgi:CSLREA domain-containing protein
VSITVDTTADETLMDGHCSLRQAILAANLDTAVDACPAGHGHDVILLPAGTYTLTISGVGENGTLTGDLDITDDLTVSGSGAANTAINANGVDRVFHILSTADVTLMGLTVRGGQETVSGGGGLYHSGSSLTLAGVVVANNTTGVRHGGGLYIDIGHAATLLNTTVRDNTATEGGGLYNAGTLSVTASVVVSNTASLIGGGLRNASTGELTVVNTTLANNRATTSNGGGLYTTGQAAVINSTLTNNTSGDNGGGIEVRDASLLVTATLMVSNTTLSYNTSATSGGGLHLRGSGTTGGVTALIINSTFSGNTTGASGGGGLRNNTDATTTLINLTLTNNSAGNNNGGGLRNDGALTLTNVLIANHPVGGNCEGTFTSLGHNLSSDATCAALTAPGDQNSVNPQLGPLANNGGPTLTHAIPVTSPAINAGSNASCPATDQRGVPRDARCDIGAFELPTMTVYLPLVRR